MSEKLETETKRLVYIGQSESTRGVAYGYVLATDLDGARMLFGKPLRKKQGRPGTMLDCECVLDDEGSINSVGATRHAGFLDDKDHVVRWQLEHNAFRLKRKQLADRNRDIINEVFGTVRLVYQTATASQRQAMLAYIIWYLTK